MSFQWIIDNAVDIAVDRQGIVSQTVARNQTVRAVSRGGRIHKFSVTPSPGELWTDTDVRKNIQLIENANRYTESTVNFAHVNLFKYQGNGTGTGWTASYTKGTSVFSMSGGTFTSGYRFRAGDIVQFGSGTPVYTITADVPYTQSTNIPINRTLNEDGSGVTLLYGNNVVFKVICTQLPTYKITPNNIIEWSGAFEFYEVVV